MLARWDRRPIDGREKAYFVHDRGSLVNGAQRTTSEVVRKGLPVRPKASGMGRTEWGPTDELTTSSLRAPT